MGGPPRGPPPPPPWRPRAGAPRAARPALPARGGGPRLRGGAAWPPPAAVEQDPWQAAGALRGALADAQTELIVGTRSDAAAALDDAATAAGQLAGDDPAADRDV
ncbi:MAG: hypothetical protein ABW216_22615, partial [Candidatus Rokuibacteriota bacterium]